MSRPKVLLMGELAHSLCEPRAVSTNTGPMPDLKEGFMSRVSKLAEVVELSSELGHDLETKYKGCSSFSGSR